MTKGRILSRAVELPTPMEIGILHGKAFTRTDSVLLSWPLGSIRVAPGICI